MVKDEKDEKDIIQAKPQEFGESYTYKKKILDWNYHFNFNYKAHPVNTYLNGADKAFI